MKTIEEAIQAVTDHAADVEVRVCRRIEPGRLIQQGDIYLMRVPDDHPHGKPWGSRQVALGDTLGARHVAVGNLEVYAGDPQCCAKVMPLHPMEVRQELLGPVVDAHETWTLEHPEHPHHRMPPGRYQVIHQLDRQTMRRVAD